MSNYSTTIASLVTSVQPNTTGHTDTIPAESPTLGTTTGVVLVDEHLWHYVVGATAGGTVLLIILLLLSLCCNRKFRESVCKCCIQCACSECCKANCLSCQSCFESCCQRKTKHVIIKVDEKEDTVKTQGGLSNGSAYPVGTLSSNASNHSEHPLINNGSPRTDISHTGSPENTRPSSAAKQEGESFEMKECASSPPDYDRPSSSHHTVTAAQHDVDTLHVNDERISSSPQASPKSNKSLTKNGNSSYKGSSSRASLKSTGGSYFTYVPTCPDGDCFFRAVSIATHPKLQNCHRHGVTSLPVKENIRTLENDCAIQLRKKMIDFMKEHSSRYEKKALELQQGDLKDIDSIIPHVENPAPIHDEQYQSFYDEMSAMEHPGTYACHLEIDAVSEMERTRIVVYQRNTMCNDKDCDIFKAIEFGKSSYEKEIQVLYNPINHGRSGHYDALVLSDH